MNTYIIILRLIHILCGVLWAGGIFMLHLFVIPAINASGPEGGKVMRQLSATNHFTTVMTSAATLNIIAGLLLYWNISNGLSPEWIHSPYGMTVTIGGLLAIVAYILGITINRPGVNRITKIGNDIAAAGGKPTESQVAEMTSIRARIAVNTRNMAVLLAITVACMAAARYLNGV